MIASHLDLPVVPVRIVGLDKVLHRSWKWPRSGRVELKFGKPMRLSGADFARSAEEVEAAVRSLA